jgi:hypothetical protein
MDMGEGVDVDRELDEERRATSSAVADAIASAQAAGPSSSVATPGLTSDPSDPAEGEGPRPT